MEQDETEVSTSSIPRETTNWPLEPSIVSNKRENRKSLRVRPSQILENDAPVPLSPMNHSFNTSPPERTSRMSLFHLFSRPKVEKQRGYAERSLERPVLPVAKHSASSSPNLRVQVQPPEADATIPRSLSAQTDAAKSPSKLTFQEPPPRAAHERKFNTFEPPPLFQAYPQSTKDGILEVSMLSAEAALQKSKSKKGTALQANTVDSNIEETLSFETKRTHKSTLKHVANGSSINVELPKKIFVLVTSGYLLQYTETGPSDRLPERMLNLGKESAAFACDLLPGKHYVLQVSQAVDPQGVIIANSGSIFSKLGIRSTAAKRMTSSFLLIMPNAREMESWMSAIRQEIENLGGKKVVPDPGTSSTSEVPAKLYGLQKISSSSHRYQIKRNPSKVTPATSSTNAASSRPSQAASAQDHDDTATLDGIENEASELNKDGPEAIARDRSISDVHSISSSAATSADLQHLNNMRSSLSFSTRASNTSQAATVATTVGSSRTNSLVGTPPSPQALPGGTESVRQKPLPFKSRYRPMVPYNPDRRISTQPLPTPKEGQALPAIKTSPIGSTSSVVDESPVVSSSPPLSTTTSPSKSLATTQRKTSFEGSMSVKEKHDSKVPSPPSIPAAESERPASWVADLPPPSTWSTSLAASRRTSLRQSARSQASGNQLDQAAVDRRTSMAYSPAVDDPVVQGAASPSKVELNKPKRISFSMPLKVNPSGQHALPQPSNRRRVSSIHDPDSAGESPVVHTLTATVDGTKRVSFSQIQSNRRSSYQTDLQRSPSATPSPRLSLFPSPVPLPTGSGLVPSRRSSSATGYTSYVPASATPQTSVNGRALKRPASLQVRSDHAPFLSSARNSTGPADIRTAPIRAMKPSRSASSVATLGQLSDRNAFRGLNSDTTTVFEEADKATPLPSRSVSPMPSRPDSRPGSRKSLRPRSSLPELDLGIPVVGLGPPAPPPSAPLPLLPPSSRPTSPTAMDRVSPGINAVAGLGIRVS